MSEVEETVAEETVVENTVEEPTEVVEDQKVVEPEETPVEPEEVKEEYSKKVQKRIDALTREKYNLKAENEALKARNYTPERPAEIPAEKPLDINDFEDVGEYIAKLAEQKTKEIFSKEQVSNQQHQQHQRLVDSYNAKVAEAKKIHEDFDEIVRGSNVVLPNNILNAILASEKGAEITYALAKDPALAWDIANNPNPYVQAMEIGKLETKLSVSKPVKGTGAPRPAQAIRSGGGVSINKDPAKMNPEEYRTWKRNKRKG